MTREDRREKDAAVAARHRADGGTRCWTMRENSIILSVFRKRKVEEVDEAKRPGDPGWVGRARVPQAEMQEYVSRPEWQTTVQISDKKQKKGVSCLATFQMFYICIVLDISA